MSQKSNATYIALESILLYSHNKTSLWLNSKPPDEKDCFKLRFFSQKNISEAQRKSKQNGWKGERDHEEEDKGVKMLTLQIQQIGLWTCCEDMKDTP